MKALNYTEAREKFADTIKHVCRDHTPILITRKRDDAVVMISLADYDSLTETAYLLKSPTNAQRLLDSVSELNNGKGRERKLIE